MAVVLAEKKANTSFDSRSKRLSSKCKPFRFLTLLALAYSSYSQSHAETVPFNPKFQLNYQTTQFSGDFISAETALSFLKFGKTTLFLDAEVQGERPVVAGQKNDFQFSSAKFAVGGQYRKGNTFIAEGRVYGTALPTFKGLGFRGYIGKNWGSNSFSADGYWQKGKRKNFDVETFLTPVVDREGNQIDVPNFRIVERFDVESQGELNANLYLSGGFLPQGMRISANGRLFRRNELNFKSATNYAQANIQQDIGPQKRFSPRSKLEFNGVYDNSFESRAYARLHYALIDKQRFQAQIVPGAQINKSKFADDAVYATYTGARLRWLPTNKQEVTAELEVLKNLNDNRFLTYNFQGIHSYRIANNWLLRNNLLSNRFADQVSVTYEPHLIWNKGIANLDLNASYGKNFTTKATNRALGLNLSIRPRFDAKLQYELLLNGRVFWVGDSPSQKRLEAALRINF